MMRSSYSHRDVTILLKDVTGRMEPLDTARREARIQGGVHYSEMLPLEYSPTPRYLELYHEALEIHGEATAEAVAVLGEKILAARGRDVVLVSLARAGTPVGILLRRYLRRYRGLEAPHYTISIIRGRGIDHNAMKHLLKRHEPQSLQFVDGWIGKGAIIGELRAAMEDYPEVSPELGVLADPAGLTALSGSREDFLIPSACLNATVSGLFSRTILNREVIGPEDYHGAVYYPELEDRDLSNHFLDGIEALLAPPVCGAAVSPAGGLGDIDRIAAEFGVRDRNFIKPGIGETTRVLLRRLPWKILLRDPEDEAHVGHIKRLCREKGVAYSAYPLKTFRACGVIRDLSDA